MQTKHKPGELVYYKGSLGYIQDTVEVRKNVFCYHVYWFNEKVEEDISTEWDDTVDGLKRNMEKYLNEQS
jgi:hypothetical protein